jgi:hypothetical protein
MYNCLATAIQFNKLCFLKLSMQNNPVYRCTDTAQKET